MLTYTTVLNWKRQVENWVHKPEEEVYKSKDTEFSLHP